MLFGIRVEVLDLLRLLCGFVEGHQFAELFEVNELETTVIVFDDRGERLNPIARVEIVDIANVANFRRVDVSADHAHATLGLGQGRELLFEFRDMADGGLDLGLDRFAERIVLLAPPGAKLVVNPVEAQEETVTEITKVRDDDHVLDHRVEDVAVQNQVVTLTRVMDVVFDDIQISEFQREKT